ncbi:MAG: hypothetical protein Q8Q09_06050 [Deltaproteobacteria bacterium]|nr:hypothetical protein [Deltaproteobacteria bacterium]
MRHEFAHALADAWAEATKTTARDPDAMPPNLARRLAFRFLTLAFRLQITVAKNLDVFTSADLSLSDQALVRVIFERARKKGLLGKLWAETEKLHTDPADCMGSRAGWEDP